LFLVSLLLLLFLLFPHQNHFFIILMNVNNTIRFWQQLCMRPCHWIVRKSRRQKN
jgi:hypothetical protein